LEAASLLSDDERFAPAGEQPSAGLAADILQRIEEGSFDPHREVAGQLLASLLEAASEVDESESLGVDEAPEFPVRAEQRRIAGLLNGDVGVLESTPPTASGLHSAVPSAGTAGQSSLAEAGAGSPRMVRVGLVSDQRLLLDGLALLLRAQAGEVVAAVTCTTWAELVSHCQFPFDVVVLDLQLNDGLTAATKIATLRAAGVAAVPLSTSTEPTLVRECIGAGALAFVSKLDHDSVLLDAVRAAADGEPYLSPETAAVLIPDRRQVDASLRLTEQERRVLMLYASGLPMKSVARRMAISTATVRGYLERVRLKYYQVGRVAQTQAELQQRGIEDGYLPLSPQMPESL
jgi:DNA-binding NarL/FixJ family response regulator